MALKCVARGRPHDCSWARPGQLPAGRGHRLAIKDDGFDSYPLRRMNRHTVLTSPAFSQYSQIDRQNDNASISRFSVGPWIHDGDNTISSNRTKKRVGLNELAMFGDKPHKVIIV